jgi:hypothetical protein
MSKKEIFSRLALDLARFTADYPGQILCPLCLTPYAEDALDSDDPLLTEEHIIPGELGGRVVTLSCKACNNTHGSEIDRHLIERVRSRDIFDGHGTRPFRGRIEIAGLTVPTDIDWKAPVGEMTTFQLRQFDPAVHDAIRERFKDGSVASLGVTMLPNYVPLRASLGVLRIGYLAMFHAVGYGYILSPAARVVRELIADFENVPLEVDHMALEANSISPLPAQAIEFHGTSGASAVMVLIRLTADTTRYYAAFMPRPEVQPEHVVSALCAAAEGLANRPNPQAQTQASS